MDDEHDHEHPVRVQVTQDREAWVRWIANQMRAIQSRNCHGTCDLSAKLNVSIVVEV